MVLLWCQSNLFIFDVLCGPIPHWVASTSTVSELVVIGGTKHQVSQYPKMLVSTEEHQPINKYCCSWELFQLGMWDPSLPGHVCPPATVRPQGRMWMSRFWAAFWVKHQRFQVPRIQVLTYVSTIEYGCCEGIPTAHFTAKAFGIHGFQGTWNCWWVNRSVIQKVSPETIRRLLGSYNKWT